jgi:nucleoside-diphosphate-sugar epimerase
MKALVTGANGFTGSYLVKHLIAKGYEVRGLVRKNSKMDLLNGQRIELVYGDLADNITPYY